jgi:hypothetical protein
MKNVDRKFGLMVVLGVVLVAPFLLIASAVGIHAAGLVGNAKPEVFCLLLVLASVAARISDGHLTLGNTAKEQTQRSSQPTADSDLRRSSAIRVGY